MRRRTVVLAWLMVLCIGAGALIGGSASAVTIELWLEPGDRFEWRYPSLIAEIEQANPDLKINWSVLPWSGHLEKWTTAIATGMLPDIGVSYTGLFATWLQPRNILMPLDQFMGEGGITRENINGLEAYGYIFQDKVYALPTFLGISLHAQNVDMFKKAGVPLLPQDRPASWEEYTDTSAKLTRDFDGDGVPDQYAGAFPGVPAPATGDHVFTVFLTAGVEVIENNEFGLNNATGIEALKWLIEYDKKYSPPGVIGLERREMRSLFTEQIIAITRQINMAVFVMEWPKTYPDLNALPAVPPRWNVPEGTDYGCANCYVMFADSENPKEAWKFLQAFFSKENMIQMTEKVGVISTRKDVGADYIPLEDEFNRLVMDVVKVQAPFAKGEPAHPKYTEVYEIALTEIQAARLGIKSPEKALADAEKRVNEVLGS